MEFGQQFRNFSKRVGFFYMLGHGTDYFTSPPKEGMLFGSEPAILGTRGQHANHQTTEAAWIQTRDLPVCSAVPQPLRHRVPPYE
jgi:hypothetical protein